MSQSSIPPKVKKSNDEDFFVVEGELLETSAAEIGAAKPETQSEIAVRQRNKIPTINNSNQTAYLRYIALPLTFLTVALLGGWRLKAENDGFIFLKPALVCLIYACILLVLFFRAGLLKLEDWFSEDFSTLKNIANASILLALFLASAQIFNSLLPEQGLPFWVVAFCFFWTLWNNLFAEFQGRRLLHSLGSVFALAFAAKYLILAYLTAPTSASWWSGLVESPAQTALTWLLDLPRFAAGTGYIQFFAVIFYLLGLLMLPVSTRGKSDSPPLEMV